MTKVVSNSTSKLTRIFRIRVAIITLAILNFTMHAATVVWNAGSGVDTNWSDTANWAGGVAPGGSDDVKFFDTGANTALGVVSNVVDGSFGGYIGTLQYGETNGNHMTLIAPGVTLNVTNGNLIVGTPADVAAAKNLTNAIAGAGGTLYVSNATGVISIAQGTATSVTGTRGNLDLSGLDNFVANLYAIGLGSTVFPNPSNAVQREAGQLLLAKTNIITLGLTDTLANYQLANHTNAIEMSRNPGNNAGILSFFYLGITNALYVDSFGFGRDKASANSAGIMAFNPAFIANSPAAHIRGNGGDSSRVTWWAIGDMNNSSSSSQVAVGTNDFTGGNVDAMVNVLSLGRDALPSHTAGAVIVGVLTFNSGTIDANTILDGNQSLGPSTSTTGTRGILNVGGANAVLKVNSSLVLGSTVQNSGAAQKTRGDLNITNGTVYANTIAVGANSLTNNLTMVHGTLVVSNSLATNAAGLFTLSISNSTLGLTIPANASLKTLTKTLNTVGPTNLIQLDPNPVIFSTYPTNISLIRYTTWTGSNVFGLASVPTWAPNATIVSNGPNLTVDLSLPTDPRPIIIGQPSSFSGMPGENVTTNLAVVVANGSGTSLSYFWYYFTNGATSTNLLSDGPGPSGTSTLVNTTTANMSILNDQTGDSGNYFVVVSNIYGMATSGVAVLTISTNCIPVQISGPHNQTVIQGNNATFNASVIADPAAYVQWQRGGIDIPGQNTSQLIVTNVQYPADDQAVFSIWATNECGAQTNSAILSVTVPPVITNQPANLVVTNTQSASFTVVAGGVEAPTYQWYKNSIANPILNATNATYAIASTSPSDTASYFVKVVNSAGSFTSGTATLTVNSTMAAISLTPNNGQTGVCYDTPLYITFDRAPSIRTAGLIRIFNINNSSLPVDTVDMSQGTLQSRLVGGEGFATFPVIVTGNTAAIYPHAGVLTSNQTYYVLIDDGVFADSVGAFFAGITATNTWQFTTKPTGPANPNSLLVAQDYSGDFATFQGAIDSLPANNITPTTINVNNGLYTEIVNIRSKNNILFRGQSRNGTVVGYANNNNNNASTHFRMAIKVNANDISFDNLTITNSTPQDLSQAEALMIESGAQRIIVNNCNVDSTQDTVLANISTSKAYFNRSLIQGDVDFIWGGGNLFFTNCEIRYLIRTNNNAALGPNPSPGATDIGSNGFSFVNCSYTTLPGANPGDTIGRTRGIPDGETILANCFVSTNIGGWAADALPTNNFRNYYFDCTNDLGHHATLTNGTELAPTDPILACTLDVTCWLYGWSPALSVNIVQQPANQTVNANQQAIFTVAGTGVPEPTYQWVKNGTNVLMGQTSPTLTIPNASGLDIGSYAAIVSNSSGSVTSSVVTLTVIPPTTGPTLLTPSVQGNGNVQFNISGVPGSAGFSYRLWASTNIGLTPITSTWTLLTNDVFGTSPTTFIDTTATSTGAPQRFYVITVP
jgi:pectin methylesterase-like acyl-CoA thioesterase